MISRMSEEGVESDPAIKMVLWWYGNLVCYSGVDVDVSVSVGGNVGGGGGGLDGCVGDSDVVDVADADAGGDCCVKSP